MVPSYNQYIHRDRVILGYLHFFLGNLLISNQLIIPGYQNITFDDSIVILNSTKITYDDIFVTFSGFFFFSHLTISSSH